MISAMQTRSFRLSDKVFITAFFYVKGFITIQLVYNAFLPFLKHHRQFREFGILGRTKYFASTGTLSGSLLLLMRTASHHFHIQQHKNAFPGQNLTHVSFHGFTWLPKECFIRSSFKSHSGIHRLWIWLDLTFGDSAIHVMIGFLSFIPSLDRRDPTYTGNRRRWPPILSVFRHPEQASVNIALFIP